MINVAICEDELEIAKSISAMVSHQIDEFEFEYNVDIFITASDLKANSLKYDLIFLDCRLPDENGLEAAKQFRRNGCKATIIFVTAYEEYVYESFKVDTFRYLLKPIDEQELRSAVTSYILSIEKDKFINVPTKEKIHHLNLNEIIYIESCEKHSIVRVLDDSYESTKTISEFQAEIENPKFFRTHRRYLVNMKYILEIEKNIITLSNSEKIEISRRNLSNFNKCYMNYLKYSN